MGGEGEQQVSALYVLDRATGKRVLEVPVGLSVAGVALAARWAAGVGYRRDDGELVAFDAADWTETGRLSLGVGIDTLVLSPDGETLFVGNSIGGQVHAVDAETLRCARPWKDWRRLRASPSLSEREQNEEREADRADISLVCAAVVCGAVLLWAPSAREPSS